MRLLLAMKSKKKNWQSRPRKKNGIKFSEKFFFFLVAKSWNLATPLLTPALKHSQIHVKTRKKCISARFIAK